MKLLILLGVILLLGSVYAHNSYSIPQLIPKNYNCEEHHGFISESTPFFFESSQHYVNRKSKAIQKQIEEVCG